MNQSNRTEHATLTDYIKAWPLRLLPQHALSRLMLALTRSRFRPLKSLHIAWFARHFKIDMSIAAQESLAQYPDFNSFFTRALRPGARPVVGGKNEIACPVDGAVSQAGRIESGQLIQAKGHGYSAAALLGDAELASRFAQGSFATLYLSPRDYHRIHMPADGTLREMIHIPGRLYSVNEASAKVIPGLFARNERVVTLFDTPWGPMAMVLVGAIFVGSIETVWHGVVTPPSRREPMRWKYPLPGQKPVVLQRGAEMGRFNMGSTVIMLFSDPGIALDTTIRPGAPVRMGRLLARAKS